jgi:hypothetical protein
MLILLLLLLDFTALFFHGWAVCSGVRVLHKYQDRFKAVNTKSTFCFGCVGSDFMVRRLYIVCITTVTSVLFGVKLLESVALLPGRAEAFVFFAGWSVIDILTGVSILLLHLDILSDRRDRSNDPKRES